MRPLRPTLLLGVVLVLALSGCRDRGKVVRIGAKAFAEQHILAEAMAQLIRDQGIRARVVGCDDTWECHRRLHSGELDAMVEYTGTVLSFLGGTENDWRNSFSRAAEFHAKLGVRWICELGFDNGYRIVMPTARAASKGFANISDLSTIEGGITVAIPSSYLRRPKDGLGALLSRYGLRLRADPIVMDDASERFAAVVHGRADVAVGYATDGAISELGLTLLGDPLNLFPPYRAGVVIREALASEQPMISSALGVLDQRIDEGEMRRLNRSVELEGGSPRDVARRWLASEGLTESVTAAGRQADFLVVHKDGEEMKEAVGRAMLAIRKAIPGRVVEAVTSDDPLEDLKTGRARVAVVGGESFFDEAGTRDERGEAVAVVSNRLVHLVRRDGDEEGFLSGKVGVGPAGSSAGVVGARLLEVLGKTPALELRAAELFRQLSAKRLDAVIVLAEPGARVLVDALRDGSLQLAPIGGWLRPERALKNPYLRRARIPAKTYATQIEPVETLGVQMVIAGPPRSAAVAAGAVGPAAAIPVGGSPLREDEAQALLNATGTAEAPDPVLPSFWTAAPPAREDAEAGVAAVVDTLVNGLALLFLLWLVLLVVRKDEEGPAAQ